MALCPAHTIINIVMHAHTKHVNDIYAHNMKVNALLGSVKLVFRIFFFAMNCK